MDSGFVTPPITTMTPSEMGSQTNSALDRPVTPVRLSRANFGSSNLDRSTDIRVLAVIFG